MDLSKLINGATPEADPTPRQNHLPAGSYDVVIEKIEPRSNDNGWKALNFQLRVFGEKFNNAVIFDSVTIALGSTTEGAKKAVEFGKNRIAKIASIAGTSDTNAMLGTKVHIAVGVKDDEYKIANGELDAKKNVIWGYTAIETAKATKEAKSATMNGTTTIKTNDAFSQDEIPF